MAQRPGLKWADAEDEEEDNDEEKKNRYEGPVNEQGIKHVVEYIPRNGKTYKVTKKVRQTSFKKMSNSYMEERKTMKKFGRAADEGSGDFSVGRAEEIKFEMSRKNVSLNTNNDAEDKFLEESLAQCESLHKQKQVWVSKVHDDVHDEPKADIPATPDPTASNAVANAKAPSKTYVPPSMRSGSNKGGSGGKDASSQQQQEASLRITNLSEDVSEDDLRNLFSCIGRVHRVYLATDQNTKLCRGFAFVTYGNREDAQKAIKQLNGWGYDNLIMQVAWAKPRP